MPEVAEDKPHKRKWKVPALLLYVDGRPKELTLIIWLWMPNEGAYQRKWPGSDSGSRSKLQGTSENNVETDPFSFSKYANFLNITLNLLNISNIVLMRLTCSTCSFLPLEELCRLPANVVVVEVNGQRRAKRCE